MNILLPRLDEMDFQQIANLYEKIFIYKLKREIFIKVKNDIQNIYEEFVKYESLEFKIKGGTLGRGEIKWGRNIIWGWFIEELFLEYLKLNKNISNIKLLGGDSSHKFIYNGEEKKIIVEGIKSVQPDFIITLNNGKKFCLELKTSAKKVFTIKKGNVEQLYKESAYNNHITLILMIDLVNQIFSLENLKYFSTLKPFVNQRIEGQLCYNFPTPESSIVDLKEEDFGFYIDETIFELEYIKKLKAQKLAEGKKDKRLIKIIKNKIKLEKKKEEKIYQIDLYDNAINNIINKCPEIEMSWQEIYKELKMIIKQ